LGGTISNIEIENRLVSRAPRSACCLRDFLYNKENNLMVRIIMIGAAPAAILAFSAAAFAQQPSHKTKALTDYTEYASPNAAYVVPLTAPSRVAPGVPFTWTEKHSFDRATVNSNQ
jgi:hypothetical protein